MGLDPMTELTKKAKEIKAKKEEFQKCNEEAEACRNNVEQARTTIQESEQYLSQIETALVKFEQMLLKKKETEKKLRAETATHVLEVQKWQTVLSRALALSNEVSQMEGELHEIKQRVKAETKQQIRRSLLQNENEEE
jgi:predicted  nucleic acid-binding Zn-ribbon protein